MGPDSRHALHVGGADVFVFHLFRCRVSPQPRRDEVLYHHRSIYNDNILPLAYHSIYLYDSYPCFLYLKL